MAREHSDKNGKDVSDVKDNDEYQQVADGIFDVDSPWGEHTKGHNVAQNTESSNNGNEDTLQNEPAKLKSECLFVTDL